MIAVSDDFTDAEQADVNKPSAKIYLMLGNYATSAAGASASASGSDGSGNFPASGAIDGDRTELNVGAASGADNNVGLGSWRSAVAPSVTPQTFTVDMGKTRTINRVKLYHLSAHGLKSFKIEYSADNAIWTLIDKTTDQGGSIATAHTVDTVDFSDAACRYVKVTISDTVAAADVANIVEFEIYRLVDITSRVVSCRTSSARDYQLNNSLAATAQIVCSNTDKFFSPNYTPTADQTDFINSELKPGLGIIVKFGFDYTGSQEYAQQFIGSIDRFTVKPAARTCSIDARDGMKVAFNKIVSTKLKTNQDLGALVTYMLNQANISTWETNVGTTGITIDYFFTFEQTIISVIQLLVEAGGDCVFFFAEDGTATFSSYLRSTALSHTDTEEADFEAGTLIDIDTTSEPGKIKMKWFKVEDFSDGDFSSNPAWTQAEFNGSGGSISKPWTITAGAADANVTTTEVGNLGSKFLLTPFAATSGTWAWRTKLSVASTNSPTSIFYFMSNGGSPSRFGFLTNSYGVEIIPQGGSHLVKFIGSTRTSLASWTGAPTDDGNFHSIRVTRTAAGVMNVYVDGVLKATATDTDIAASTQICCAALNGDFTGGNHVYFDDIYYSQVVEASEVTNGEGVFVSQTIDQGAGIATEGIFQTTQLVPTGTTITWYTATSADGVTWDAYVAVTPGDVIASTPKRYLRYKAILDSTAYLVTPTITDVTPNWTIGVGSSKYPTAISFSFDESLSMDLDQIYADTIAGDSAIVNSVGVTAQPLGLSGTDADVQWQGTTGTPPVAVSVGNPLGVTNGQTLTYPISVSSGMDTSRMSGANPAAAAITFAGGGAGSWVFSNIHPTKPVLVITITGTGNITNLQVQGKSFSGDNTFLEMTATDSDSIKEFGERKTQISSPYIVNSATAQSIADRIVADLSEPTTYSPQLKIRPTFSVQIGDRVTLINSQLDIAEDNLVIGVSHQFAANLASGDVSTMLKLLKIPT